MTARLLIDQCVSRRMAIHAFALLADIAFVADLSPGAADVEVLAMARRDARILVTEDYDFGRLIFGDGVLAPFGIIHLELAGMSKQDRYQKFRADAAALIVAAPGRFVVFSRGPMRARALPADQAKP